MPSTPASLSIHDLRDRLDDVMRLPVAKRRAALAEVQRIETELRAIPSEDTAGPRTAALVREALFVLADLVPGLDQHLFAGQRGSPDEHPPVPEVLAALGLIKNTLIDSLPQDKGPAVPQPAPRRPEPSTQEARDE
jgi:hypothetical protein